MPGKFCSDKLLLNESKSRWPLSFKRRGICQSLTEQGAKRIVEISSSKLNIGTGPDKCEANLIMWSERAFPLESQDFFFFYNRGRYFLQKASGCSESRQKSIAHLLRISELVCVECNWVPEHTWVNRACWGEKTVGRIVSKCPERCTSLVNYVQWPFLCRTHVKTLVLFLSICPWPDRMNRVPRFSKQSERWPVGCRRARRKWVGQRSSDPSIKHSKCKIQNRRYIKYILKKAFY